MVDDGMRAHDASLPTGETGDTRDVESLSDADRALQRLDGALASPAVAVRRRAIAALAELDDPRGIPRLVSLWDASPRDLRGSILTALGALLGSAPRSTETEAGLSLLNRTLGDTSATLRRQAAAALGRLGQVDSMDSLVLRWESASPGDRGALADALGALISQLEAHLAEDAAAAMLERALRCPVPAIRLQAATALGRRRHVPAIEPLVELWSRSTPANQHMVASAISSIVSHLEGSLEREEVIRTMHRTLRYPIPSLRRQAIATLGRMRSVESVDVLLEEAGTSSLDTSATIVRALESIATPEAESALLELLERDRELHPPVIRALDRMGSARSVEPLIELANHRATGGRTRSRALEAVRGIQQRLGDPDAGRLTLSSSDAESGMMSFTEGDGTLSFVDDGDSGDLEAPE